MPQKAHLTLLDEVRDGCVPNVGQIAQLEHVRELGLSSYQRATRDGLKSRIVSMAPCVILATVSFVCIVSRWRCVMLSAAE